MEKHDLSKVPRADSVNEIIRQDNGPLAGLTLYIVAFIVFGAILSTYFITYKNTITVDVVVQGTNSPKEIVTKAGGRIKTVFKTNSQLVRKNEIIAWVESSENREQINDLYKRLWLCEEYLEKGDQQKALALFDQSYSDLGELQPLYENFFASWSKLERLLIAKKYDRSNFLIQEELANISRIKEQFLKEKELIEMDNELSQEQFKASEFLYKRKVISLDEFRRASSNLIQMKSSLPRVKIEILNQESKIIANKRQLIEAERSLLEASLALKTSSVLLKNGITNWIAKYAIKAPTDGKIAFSTSVQPDLTVKEGQSIGVVNPKNNLYYADLKVSQRYLGELSTEMDASIRIDAYPYSENGIIKGRVAYISDVSSDGFFMGKIELPNGLVTTYNKNIPFKAGLSGQAIIVTKKTRLLKKLYENILKK